VGTGKKLIAYDGHNKELFSFLCIYSDGSFQFNREGMKLFFTPFLHLTGYFLSVHF